MPSTGPPTVAVQRPGRGWRLVLAAICCVASPVGPGVGAPAPASAATYSESTIGPVHADGWRWPVEGSLAGAAPTVLRGFDPPDAPWGSGHRGVDLEAEPDTVVRAAGPGTVVFADALAGRGVVSIQHADGLRTTYEPVTPAVTVGQRVVGGAVIGTLEPLTTHCARTCLHWGLKQGEGYLDPLSMVHRAPPVLLPYGPPRSQRVDEVLDAGGWFVEVVQQGSPWWVPVGAAEPFHMVVGAPPFDEEEVDAGPLFAAQQSQAEEALGRLDQRAGLGEGSLEVRLLAGPDREQRVLEHHRSR